jgi:LuxR family transcriptional regulator, maltose regulon positive regulatory protein
VSIRVLATKLHIPRPRPGSLDRSRLLERLSLGTAGELTLVCAPAGFGKTTLLGEWARRSRRPVAWLSLDAGDSDPARFWRAVAAALDGTRAGLGQRAAALLQGPQLSLEAMLSVLVDELLAVPGEVVLVLDDYHLVEAPPVHDSLAVLLERLPPQLRLVVASRADPPLPLARLRARGQLAELRQADLRFSPEETAELLRAAVGPDLPRAAVTALEHRTEGWVAGLQLAALSLQGRPDVAAFVDGFSGGHRHVLDYLAEEVLDRQPAPLRSFLLETSILERLCGPLCDQVTGRTGSQQLLEQAERANLFLVPLDEVRGWWRYHPLFADLLLTRLSQRQPGLVPQLHRNAAAWHETHGLADEAVGHALAAGDTRWAALLVERHVEALYRRSETATLQRWFAALPAGLVRSRPRLCLAMASWASIAGRLQEVEELLADAERAQAADADEPFEPSVGRELSTLANVPAAIAQLRAELARQHRDPERAASFARRSLASLDEADRTSRLMVGWQLAMADWMRGRPAEAERALNEVVGDRYLLSVRPWYDLGHVQQTQGRLGAALASFAHAVEVASEAGHPLPLAGMGHAGLAEVRRERNELDAAMEHAAQAVALCRQLPYAQWLVTALAVLAWTRQAVGDEAGALDAIGEAERVAPGQELAADMLSPVGLVRARLALAQGRVADAADWASGQGLDAEDEVSFLREREHLVLARVLLARHTPDRAIGLLARLHALAAGQGRTGSLIEVQALEAQAHAAAGAEPAALSAMAAALTLAAPEGYLRAFLDQGAPLAALLGRLAATPARAQAVTRLARAHLGRLVLAFEDEACPCCRDPGPAAPWSRAWSRR